MKALKQMTVKINGSSYKIAVGREVPKVVVDFWKSNNQITDLVKSGSIASESQAKSSVSSFNVQPCENKK